MDWNIGKGHKEKMGCPVGFSEEFIAVFLVKVSQIETETDKKPENYQFLEALCIFC